MAPKELKSLRLLIDNPQGLYGSQFVHLSEGFISRGTVYTLLERLLEKGYVREVEEAPSDIYQLARTRHFLTAKGRQAYDAFLADQGLQMVPSFQSS